MPNNNEIEDFGFDEFDVALFEADMVTYFEMRTHPNRSFDENRINALKEIKESRE